MLAGLDANQSVVKAYLCPLYPSESASQLLSLVYLFLLSRRAAPVKCYYRLLPLRFVSLTVTFTGNLRETIGKNSSQALLGSAGLSPRRFSFGSNERKM